MVFVYLSVCNNSAHFQALSCTDFRAEISREGKNGKFTAGSIVLGFLISDVLLLLIFTFHHSQIAAHNSFQVLLSYSVGKKGWNILHLY